MILDNNFVWEETNSWNDYGCSKTLYFHLVDNDLSFLMEFSHKFERNIIRTSKVWVSIKKINSKTDKFKLQVNFFFLFSFFRRCFQRDISEVKSSGRRNQEMITILTT